MSPPENASETSLTPSSPSPVSPLSPASVTDFWLHPDMRKRWFTDGAELDSDIRRRFGAAVALAQAGDLIEWESEPSNRLALVLLLDQFPRNIFRGKAKAFTGDEREEFIAGLIAVAVPVFGAGGEVRAAIAVHAPTVRMTLDDAVARIDALKAAAERMTALL